MWELDCEESWAPKNWCFWTVVLEKKRSNQSILKEISPGCSLERLMLKLKLQYFGHLMQRVDSLEKTLMLGGIGSGGEVDDRGWDDWMASPTQRTWVWVNSGRWWWTGRPGVSQFMGSQRVRHDWVTELNWTNHYDLNAHTALTLFSPDQFILSVVSTSLWPHESQHARPPCPSLTPGVHPNSHPSSRWCHPVISSSVVPFSSCPQSLPASGSFPMSQLFAWNGQSIRVSASASVLPKNTQDWSPLGWTGWISLQSKGLSRVFSNTTVQKHQFFGAQLSL